MKMSQAIEGFLLDRRASGYSDKTIHLYRICLRLLCDFLSDPPINKITLTDLQRYMIYLQHEYEPKRKDGSTGPLSQSAVSNHWKAIRSLFNWCSTELGVKRPDTRLVMPPCQKPELTIPTEDEIRRILKACERTIEAETIGRKSFSMKRPTATRDKALILLFVDTGLRVSEVCRLRIEDVNLETGDIIVAPHGSGQKTKSRTVHIGKVARRAMWLYLAKRPDYTGSDKLFELDAESIRSLFKRLGEKAEVSNFHPHALRHFFCTTYLRNGGDVFSLQKIIGHSSLDMVERYLHLVRATC